jgi:hypothetical protein
MTQRKKRRMRIRRIRRTRAKNHFPSPSCAPSPPAREPSKFHSSLPPHSRRPGSRNPPSPKRPLLSWSKSMHLLQLDQPTRERKKFQWC